MRNCCLLLSMLLLMHLSAGDFSQARDLQLDPGPITWWKERWAAAPIEISRPNASSSGVSITFKYRTSTAISQGCLEIYFPTDIVPASVITGNYVQFCSLNLNAGQDYQQTVSITTFPTAEKAYGPFRILTRSSATGQVKDVNWNFGVVYVSEKLTNQQNLIVSGQNLSQVPVGSTVTLEFAIYYNVDIWRHDVVQIKTSNLWTTPTGPICQSSQISQAYENHFLTPDGEERLDCVSDQTSGYVYIYGLGNDIINNLETIDNGASLGVKFSVSGYTAPSANWSEDNYQWQLDILRAGTRNSIGYYVGYGPLTGPGEISITKWEPHGNFNANDLLLGLSLYYDVEFTVKHTVPQNGYIDVQYSGVNVSTTEWRLNANALTTGSATDKAYCFVEWMGSATSCATTTRNVRITATQAIQAGTVIQLTTYTKFTGSAPSVKATSYYQANVEIDDSSAKVLSYSSNGVKLLQEYVLLFGDGTGATNLIDAGGEPAYIYAYLRVTASNTGTSIVGKVSINLPINNSGLSDQTIYISQDVNISGGPFKCKSATFAYAGNENNRSFPSITAQSETDAYSNNSSIFIEGVNFSSSVGGAFGFYNNGGIKVYLPRVASNQETRYETFATVTLENSSGVQQRYVFAQVVTISASTFTSLTLTGFCGANLSVGLQTKFDVLTILNQNKQYYLDLEFTAADLTTGLTVGDEYPIGWDSSLATRLNVNARAVLATNRIIRIYGQDLYNSAQSLLFYTVADQTAVKVTLYYVHLEKDSSLQYIIFQETPAAILFTAIGGSPIAVTHGSLKVSADNTVSSAALAGMDTGSSRTYSVQFPPGFRFDNPNLLLTNSATSSQVITLQSTNPEFKYPTIFAKMQVANASSTFNVSGAKNSLYVQTSDQYIFFAENAASVCEKASAAQTLTNGSINISAYSPTQVEGRGPESYSHAFSVTFATETGAPVNSYIEITLDASWTPISTACTATNLIGNPTVTCTISGNVLKVSGYQAFTSSQVITVTVAEVMPPTNGTGSDATGPHLNTTTGIETKICLGGTGAACTGGTIYSIDKVGGSASSVTITPKSASGKSLIKQVSTIPPNASITGVDFYMKFRLDHKLPKGATITISSPVSFTFTNSNVPQNFVNFSEEYDSVTVTTNQLVLTTSYEIQRDVDLELFIDQAMTNPDQTTTTHFLIKSEFGGQTFDNDVEADGTQAGLLTVQPATTGTITEDPTSSITLNNTTANEYADYTFQFSSSAAVSDGNEIWIRFPSEYDDYVGITQEKFPWRLPGYYYIDCVSAKLGADIYCIVSRRFVIVKGVGTVAASDSISITINKVMNPGYTGVSSTTAAFGILHIDSTGSALAVKNDIQGIATTVYAGNLTLKRVVPASQRALEKTQYTFEWFANITTPPTTSELHLILPPQYQTHLNHNTDPFQCTMTYNDLTFLAETHDSQEITGIGQCGQDRNWVTTTLADTSGFVFTDERKYNFVIAELTNPYFGYMRTPVSNHLFTWDFEANDSDLFTLYDIWTTQSELLLRDTTNKATVVRSYLNVNAAYLGFQYSKRSFVVGDFEPLTEANKINVILGTQTPDIYIKTEGGQEEPCSARFIEFSPVSNAFYPDNNQISYTSKDDFKMFHGEYQIRFRISASTSVTPGIYYINWELTEEKQDSLISSQYDSPPKTLVEVASTSKASFTVSSIGTIPIGNTSRPIKVHTENSPHQDVTVEIALAASVSGITITPTNLNFRPNINHLYFTISVDSTFNQQVLLSYTLNFTISGSSSESYKSISSKTFNVSTNTAVEAAVVTNFSHTEPSRTSTELRATSDSNGILMFVVAAKGSPAKTYAEVKAQADSIFAIGETVEGDTTERSVEYEPSEADNNDARLEGWVAFKRRMYKTHIQSYWYGAAISTSNTLTSLGTQDYLYAETEYIAWCYADNGSGQESDAATTSWKTQNLPEAARFTLKFTADISSNYITKFKQFSATAMGLSPDRLIRSVREQAAVQKTSGGNHEASETYFHYIIPANRGQAGPKPADIVDLEDWQEEDILARIDNEGLSAVPSFTTEVLQKSSYLDPTWNVEGEPKMKSSTSSSITIEMQPTTVGECCCQANTLENTDLTATQLLLGVDQNNADTISQCADYTDTSSSLEITLSGLAANTTYYTSCMCFNDYPLWPEAMAYVEGESQATSVSSSTQPEEVEEDDDFANLIGVLGLVLVLV